MFCFCPTLFCHTNILACFESLKPLFIVKRTEILPICDHKSCVDSMGSVCLDLEELKKEKFDFQRRYLLTLCLNLTNVLLKCSFNLRSVSALEDFSENNVFFSHFVSLRKTKMIGLKMRCVLLSPDTE